MRRGAVAIGAAWAVLAAAGCGGTGGDLTQSLSYLPASTPGVALVTTNLEDDQWHSFNGTLAPILFHVSARRLVGETAERAGLSFPEDVLSQLGNQLVVGVAGAGAHRAVVAALQARDPARLEHVLRALAFRPAGRAGAARLWRAPVAVGRRLTPAPAGTPARVAVDGDVVVAATTEAALRRVVADRHRPGRLTPEILKRALHGLPGDAFVRIYGSLRGVAAVAPRRLAWLRVLRSYAVAVSVRRHVLEVKAIVRTAAGRATDASAPLAPGRATIPVRTAEAVAGLRETRPAAAFALALLSGPPARTAAVRTLLRQLAGPAFVAYDPDGDLWVRAKVDDPVAARRALRAAAGPLGLRPVGGGTYRAGAGGPLVGLVDDAFLVAPDRRNLRRAAGEATVALTGAAGALVARADFSVLGPELERLFGIQLGALDEAIAYASADRRGLRAVLRIGVR